MEVRGEYVTSTVDDNTWKTSERINMLEDEVYTARSNGQLPVTGGIGLNLWAGGRGGNTDGMLWDDIKITVHSVID